MTIFKIKQKIDRTSLPPTTTASRRRRRISLWWPIRRRRRRRKMFLSEKVTVLVIIDHPVVLVVVVVETLISTSQPKCSSFHLITPTNFSIKKAPLFLHLLLLQVLPLFLVMLVFQVRLVDLFSFVLSSPLLWNLLQHQPPSSLKQATPIILTSLSTSWNLWLNTMISFPNNATPTLYNILLLSDSTYLIILCSSILSPNTTTTTVTTTVFILFTC